MGEWGFFPKKPWSTVLFPKNASVHRAFSQKSLGPRGFFPKKPWSRGHFPKKASVNGAFSRKSLGPRGFFPKIYSVRILLPD